MFFERRLNVKVNRYLNTYLNTNIENMIYLIGGPPKCGKTTLAKTFSKSAGIPWVSTDTLQCVIQPYMDKETLSEKFPTSAQRCKDNDEKYSKYSTQEIVDAYKIQAETAYQAIEMFVECEIVDGNDYIVEGYHIEPELAEKLKSKFPDKIKNIFLVKSDTDKFVADIKKSTTPNDWIIARTHDDETFSKIAEMICEYGNYFKTESEKYGFDVLNMDDDFEIKIQEAVDYLMRK
ncbi:MAG: hypothetical protein ACD_9C00039G0002 [uncultured bacterium]|nr:MAG: hypothetical protein ACD_9C00039G0002 [uncultured bacterium]